MDEFQLIDALIAPRAGSRPDVVLGIGDDGALVTPPPGETLVVVADTLVAGVHFPPQLPAEDVGYRAVAVNLSDIAAMGADPCWATLALTLPAVDTGWLQGFAAGLGDALAAHRVQLVGGDTTRGPLTITVQIIGSVPPGQALTRQGARPGDAIYVSGTLGDAAAGLAVLQAGGPRNAAETQLAARFARPVPRVALGRALRGIASSCIDVSDGLLADLGHIAERSGCALEIELAALPLSAALSTSDPNVRMQAATGGDDYELCFTVPAISVPRLPSLQGEVAVRRIGRVLEMGAGVTVLDQNGCALPLRTTGYRHFI